MWGAPYLDGGKISIGGEKVKVNLYSAKFGGLGLVDEQGNPIKVWLNPINGGTEVSHTQPHPWSILQNRFNGKHFTFNFGDGHFNISPTLSMSLAFAQDTDKVVYDTKAVGFKYKGVQNITLTGEYGRNSASYAKKGNTADAFGNPGSTPKAYFLQARYKGANPFVPGSFGLNMAYKKADAGFDIMAFASPFTWNAPLN
ncbi:MAG: S-layer y domain protein [Caproiciproducens sp.]|nr:S-layer y domain protein [Caproiciproducens sp.]